jgi:hypothetical protein
MEFQCQPRPGCVKVLPDSLGGLAKQRGYFRGCEAVGNESHHLALRGRQ